MVNAAQGRAPAAQSLSGGVACSGKQPERLADFYTLTTVAEALQIVSFDLSQDRPQIICIRPVEVPLKSQRKVFSRDLEEVHELLDGDRRGTLQGNGCVPSD